MQRPQWRFRIACLVCVTAVGGSLVPAQDVKPKAAPDRTKARAKADPAMDPADTDPPAKSSARKADPAAEPPNAGPTPGRANANDRGPRPSNSRGRGRGTANGETSTLERLRVDLLQEEASFPAILLPLPAVQKDLKLTDKQTESLKKLEYSINQQDRVLANQRQQARRTGRMNNNMNLMDDNPDMQEAEFNLRQEATQAYEQVVNKEQRRRLTQIALQILGPLAVGREDVAMKLRMTELQQAKISVIFSDRQVAQDEARRLEFQRMRNNRDAGDDMGDPDDSDRQAKRTQRQHEQTIQDLGKVLTKKQKEDFNKMLGEPFDVAALDKATGRFNPRRGSAPRDDAADPEMDDSTPPPGPARGRTVANGRSSNKAAMPEDDDPSDLRNGPSDPDDPMPAAAPRKPTTPRSRAPRPPAAEDE